MPRCLGTGEGIGSTRKEESKPSGGRIRDAGLRELELGSAREEESEPSSEDRIRDAGRREVELGSAGEEESEPARGRIIGMPAVGRYRIRERPGRRITAFGRFRIVYTPPTS